MSLLTDFENYKLPLSAEEIYKVIPHRYPFSLVDRVTELGEDFIKGYKNVTVNEPFFQGHFPDKPIMPGVLIVEAVAQLSCFHQMLVHASDKLGLFAGLDGARFRNVVVPGDRLDLHSQILWYRKGVGKCKAEVFVGDKLTFEGELTFALVDRETMNSVRNTSP
ncbi:MAG: 3-hydroxyacyl-ACP dehydratase FabZ [Candidatus Caenarcaniphilales bacterium]|nr:3-hydroxyacyl-ACP dehydratase FabZ [Candidatus Caenarcaniphilales bacterium]